MPRKTEKSAFITVRLTQDERRAIERAAQRVGLSRTPVSAWCREALLSAAKANGRKR